MNNGAENIIVSIQCLVYNHEPYLRQCLDGFVMQKTNFEFEAIVHDDVSTDGSAKIIAEYAEKYPDIIKPIYETENQYSKRDGSLERIINEACRGKYIALCEGDDYWTDPLKLQKQVDFLEANLDVGLVYTMANIYNEENARIENYNYGMPAYCFDDLVRANCIPTLTVCYRRSLLERYNREVKVDSTWAMGDYPLWLFISMKTKIHFFDEVTSVYRFIPNSASHHSDINKQLAFYKSSSDICSYFIALAGRTDLYRVYRQKYFDIIVSTYISYGLPVPYDAVRQYWIWRPKSIIKYFLSKLSYLRKKS